MSSVSVLSDINISNSHPDIKPCGVKAINDSAVLLGDVDIHSLLLCIIRDLPIPFMKFQKSSLRKTYRSSDLVKAKGDLNNFPLRGRPAQCTIRTGNKTDLDSRFSTHIHLRFWKVYG